MTYYRIRWWDIALIIATKGFWLICVLLRDDKIERPDPEQAEK